MAALASSSTENAWNMSISVTMYAALSFATGIGIVKKKRYGLILVYVNLGVICLLIIVGLTLVGRDGALSAATGSAIWVYSTIYYHKRREEFT